MVAGVARGVAEHLDVDVWWVRLVFVLLALTGGSGFVAYATLWIFVPLEDSEPSPPDAVARRGHRHGRARRPRCCWCSVRPVSCSAALLLVSHGWVGRAAAVRRWRSRASVPPSSGSVPTRNSATGCGAAWSASPRRGVPDVVQLVLGGRPRPRRSDLVRRRRGRAVGRRAPCWPAVVVIVVGIALVASPFALRVWRERDAERRARIRSEERAEMAAQVHDSVLQCLALIQRSADDPAEVARIARAQERDLRRWLYPAATSSASSFRAALEEVRGGGRGHR